jgi:hypothetical protein
MTTMNPPHYWRQGDQLIMVETRWGREAYPECLTVGCWLPVTVATGSPMRWWGLGQGWREWQCAQGHRYAYQPQGGEISHVRSV